MIEKMYEKEGKSYKEIEIPYNGILTTEFIDEQKKEGWELFRGPEDRQVWTGPSMLARFSKIYTFVRS